MASKPKIAVSGFAAAAGVSAPIGGRLQWPPGPSDRAVAATALALAVALLRSLRDRGVLPGPELDDVLADAGAQVGGAETLQLLEQVRAALEREAED